MRSLTIAATYLTLIGVAYVAAINTFNKNALRGVAPAYAHKAGGDASVSRAGVVARRHPSEHQP